MFCLSVGDKETFYFLLERPDINLEAPLDEDTGETILIRLIRLRYFELALEVLGKGANVNVQTDLTGKTALMYLLEHGINALSFMDYVDSETVLADSLDLIPSAEYTRKRSLFQAILDRPALDLTLTNSSGRNVLDFAVSRSIDGELIALLLKRAREYLGPSRFSSDFIKSQDREKLKVLLRPVWDKSILPSEI